MQSQLPTRRFQRRTEDFVCGHCGFAVQGDGFTNHCPHCLYSRHVDIQPGDRAARCGGLMEPLRLEPFRDGWKIVQRCLVCGLVRRNRTARDDAFEALLALGGKEK